ncbi:hypothetical protein MJG53_017477 [Ovis ammon polii x Ovis aries]|uniref:Uncharacterized protein n=1 Tax=Ovis ammon polii x Ovis aries TaxID=2918886 RepID=A0ACB9U8H2_9CETA|nr:hypothetical protein MJG53_017477 [Ovis ammon polii x Ovis aries]
MASGSVAECLQQETTCPVCLQYFVEPMMLDCGHNICCACLARCWGAAETNVSCPQCRETFPQRHMRPNRHLANVTQLVKQLRTERPSGPGGEMGVCEKHREPLKLYCEEDQMPICVVCDRSREHRGHSVLPLEEAVEGFKEQIQNQLDHLKRVKDLKKRRRAQGEQARAELLSLTQMEREKIVWEFEQLYHSLKEHEYRLLARLEELDLAIYNSINGAITQFSCNISHLSNLIAQLEEKQQQPTRELLQDIGDTLSRAERIRIPEPWITPPDLQEKIHIFAQKCLFLTESLKQFTEKMQSDMEKIQELREAQLYSVDVTLDPDTAYPSLILSDNLRQVRYSYLQQDLPDNPERFNLFPCVLGSPCFIAGRHYWEVEVGDKAKWTIGVCEDSVCRKAQHREKPSLLPIPLVLKSKDAGGSRFYFDRFFYHWRVCIRTLRARLPRDRKEPIPPGSTENRNSTPGKSNEVLRKPRQSSKTKGIFLRKSARRLASFIEHGAVSFPCTQRKRSRDGQLTASPPSQMFCQPKRLSNFFPPPPSCGRAAALYSTMSQLAFPYHSLLSALKFFRLDPH